MKWYNHVAAFFAGIFLCNAIPHYISGVSGNWLPTPFSDPPGQGLSSPLMNLIWAFINIAIGFLLFYLGKVSSKNRLILTFFIIGAVIMSILLSLTFQNKLT
jgi:hypothetical protein